MAMNVLYMAKTPLAGVCEKMCRVVNQYLRPDVEARVCDSGPGRHSWFSRDAELVPAYRIRDDRQLRQCIDWADVIHCMANVGIRSPFFARGYDHQKLLRTKKWVFQWHGAQIWPFEKVWWPEDYKHVDWIHIGQGWIQTQMDFFGPFLVDWDLDIVPNIIADDPLHQPRPWDERKDKTGFAPSQRKEDAVNRKGIREMRTLIRGFQWDLIHGVAYEKCLERKSKCRLGVDEIVTPMYHLSGLEFLSQGTPCFCSMTDSTKATLKEATGAGRVPFMNANPATFRHKLRRYWEEQTDEARQQQGQEARDWFVEYYHPRSLIERYIDVYKR